MDILMAGPEMQPLAKTGGLADVLGALPLALAELGEKVSVLMPCYRGIEEKFQPRPTGVTVTIPILEGDHWLDRRGEILSVTLEERIEVFLVKMDYYYDREALYTLPDGDYQDNCARFTFFCRAALELLAAREWRPSLIHCHDWQSALIPIYLKTIMKDDPLLGGTPLVFTIHNLGYQGLFWQWDMKLIGLPWEYFTPEALEFYGKLNLLKGGIVYSDRITTVSKGYAREIQSPEHGLGLDGVLQSRAADLHGIVNGVDYQVWDPEKDPCLAANYSASDLAGKKRCKAALQEELGLPVKAELPVAAVISRLSEHKGLDLVVAALEEMMELGVQFVLLGTGDRRYHEIFEAVARKHPERTGIRIGYDEALAHRIQAGADLLLMPSYYEPCGLSQLIALKYGTAPVVRATGGLDDTIVQWDPKRSKGNGFKFEERSHIALLDCLKQALEAYRRPREWAALQANGMKEDHSWGAAAKRYLELYRGLVSKQSKAGRAP